MKLTKHCLWLVLVLVLASGSAVFAQTIVHWQHHSPARNEMIEFFAREFEAQNPGVTIEFESIPLADYYTKLLPALAAGSGPDVFQLRAGDVPRYKEYEVIQALNIDHALALEEFVPGSYGFLVEDGTFYGLPTDVQTIVLFYNTTEFQDEDGKVLFDNPQGREGFEFAVDWIAKYGVEDPDFGSRWTAFREQELGMVYAHPAMLGSFRNTHPDLPIGIAEVASYKAGEPRTSVMTNWAYVASAGTDDLDLASRWIEFLTSAEAQRKWTIETGELPSRAALINDPELLEYEPLLAAPLASLESAVPYPFEALSQMDKAIRDAINRVTIAGESVDEAFEWFVQETEKVYREVILDEL